MHNKLIISVCILMMIVNVGQSVADIVTACSMHITTATSDHDEHHDMMNHSMLGHDMHHSMKIASDHNINQDDCCDTECYCPANNCSSVSVIETNSLNLNLFLDSKSVSESSLKQTISSIFNLYRPPILA